MDELTPLARAAAGGDRTALAALVRATQGDVWRLCAHLVDPAAADDLAQETYLRAIRALRGYRADGPVRAWLLTIARRACAEEISIRQRERQLHASVAASLVAGRPAPDSSLQAELSALLSALHQERRIAFVLTQVLGCSYAEAAVICGCPVGTIRSRVARARADLESMTASGDTVPPDTPASSGGR